MHVLDIFGIDVWRVLRSIRYVECTLRSGIGLKFLCDWSAAAYKGRVTGDGASTSNFRWPMALYGRIVALILYDGDRF